MRFSPATAKSNFYRNPKKAITRQRPKNYNRALFLSSMKVGTSGPRMIIKVNSLTQYPNNGIPSPHNAETKTDK